MQFKSVQFKSTIAASGLLLLASAAMAQQPAEPTVIRTETKMVLVDVVVTGKKGVYVDDLEMKNFRVWEDNKEQQVKSFSTGSDPNSPFGQKRYIVLFFDNSTMAAGEQVQARQAATKFIESNAGPDRLMAIANFTVGFQLAQNFTSDMDKLKQVVGGIRSTGLTPGPDMARLGNAGAGGFPGMNSGIGVNDYSARSLLLSMRTLAKNLGEVPGRKSLVLFTSGFPLTNEARSEATAVIDACNKSNVAIYAIDVRGVSGNRMLDDPTMGGRRGRASLDAAPAMPGAALRASGVALAPVQMLRNVALFQAAGVGAGRGSTAPATGGSTGGNAGAAGGSAGAPGAGVGSPGAGAGAGGIGGGGRGVNNNPFGNNNPTNNSGGFGNNPNNPNNPNNDPFNRNDPFGSRNNPDMRNATDNQQVMYMLADGTGGFVVTNSNDILGSLQKIGKELNAYYILGYTPPDSQAGSCHTLKVKLEKSSGTQVRSRAGYCNVKPKDVLAGNPVEKTLQSKADASGSGTVAAALRAPFFYTGPNTARVAVAMEIPAQSFKFEKVKGKFHSTVNLLGIAYKPDGSVGARFSDAVVLDFDSQTQVNIFKDKLMHYENQFDVASGTYNFKLVFEAGEGSYGKLESPLVINPYDPKEFAISGVAFSKTISKSSDADASLDSLLLEGRAPLVAGPYQFTPTGTSRFATSDKGYLYFEVYDGALLGEKPPQIGAQLRVLDPKTQEVKVDSGKVPLDSFVKAGSPIVAAGLRMPHENLPPGIYTLEVRGLDSTGAFAVRTAEFEVVAGGPKLPF